MGGAYALDWSVIFRAVKSSGIPISVTVIKLIAAFESVMITEIDKRNSKNDK